MTKSELLEQIEQKNEEINSLHNQIEQLERYKKYEDGANELRAMYDSYVLAGFSNEEAFALLNTMLAASMKPRLF